MRALRETLVSGLGSRVKAQRLGQLIQWPVCASPWSGCSCQRGFAGIEAWVGFCSNGMAIEPLTSARVPKSLQIVRRLVL